MKMSVKIDPKFNELFYREASRANGLDEINNSAGMKILISRDIEYVKEAIAREYIKNLEVVIEQDNLGYYVVATGK